MNNTTNNINNSKFSVIRGGIRSRLECEKEFLGGYVTDTRLMGAMGLCVHWRLKSCFEGDELIQFFYFDTEDIGLENYIGLWEYDYESIQLIEQTSIGCLGGIKKSITEKEVCALVKHYYQMTLNRNKKIPTGYEEYKFIIERECELNDIEKLALINKICTPIKSDFQVINYFLMRFFSHDFEGAMYLASDTLNLSNIKKLPYEENTFFCRNSIKYDNGFYSCESLLNYNNDYYVCRTSLIIDHLKVSEMKINSWFKISPQEAALILNRTEYISVYEISDLDPQQLLNMDNILEKYGYDKDYYSEILQKRINEMLELEKKHSHGKKLPGHRKSETVSFELPYSTNSSVHCNGQLIMAFKPDNSHVDSSLFLLSNDVIGTVFITPAGQLIITSYTLKDITSLEERLLNTCIPPLSLLEKFTFPEAVMQDFVGSQFDDFLDFVDFLEIGE